MNYFLQELSQERKLNKTTIKDHFPLRLIDQMLDSLAAKEPYFSLVDIQTIIRLHYPLKTNRKQPLHIHMELFSLNGFHLDYVIILPQKII